MRVKGIGELHTLALQQSYIWPYKVMLRKSSGGRGGTAHREGMVRHHRNMLGNDHIPRRNRRLVSGHVYRSRYR